MKAEVKLISIKKKYYNNIDRKASFIALKLSKHQKVTNLLMKYIKELYLSVNLEKWFIEEKIFRSAYHPSVSSDFEFLIARTLYHYSLIKKLNWNVELRCQTKKVVPDIRITKGRKTIAILELKAKAGWIQHLFSEDSYKKGLKKYRESNGTKRHPRVLIKNLKEGIEKCCDTFEINANRIFYIIPSFTLVHRQKSELKIKDYVKYFAKNTGLPIKNLIYLSNNPRLNLDGKISYKLFQPTEKFENLIASLTKI
jgi:hypothetical protein